MPFHPWCCMAADADSHTALRSQSLSLGDPAGTAAVCDASAIENALNATGADVRESINLLTEKNTFTPTCTGTGAWKSAQVSLRAAGVTVPLAAATPFTLLLDFTVAASGTTTQLSGTQAVASSMPFARPARARTDVAGSKSLT